MLRAEHITKYYGKVRAVDDVSYSLNPGEICVLLGPNGAGKSTLVKSTLGLLKHKGTVLLDREPMDSQKARSVTGYVPEAPILHELLTVKEHVQFIASAYGIKDGDDLRNELFRRLELSDKEEKLCKELSKGMQQKVSLCCAAILRPKVLFLDEPMIGLDPKAIRELKEMLMEWRASGTAILISTHIIDSIDTLWDRVLIMRQGRIIRAVDRKSLESESDKSLESLFFEVTEGAS